ncbi:MAG TPA: YlbF family regulator [Candidatus Saccharimonadia bacterium]|nr:YlbF family regulator [Candidatus Saccharimonadia bacterium]
MSSLAPSIEDHLVALCQAIAAEPSVRTARDQAEAFLADDQAVSLYRDMMNMGRTLEQRHRQGESITPDEVNTFEDLRDKADSHDGIRAFNDAQDVLQAIATAVNTYVTKTLEKGRVPAAEEVSSGSCGAGCGCH